ncbi:MAG: peptidoglycan recognition protein family protein [Oscillospiraceae bacterium]|nr:peptidoglycan recognition protein family protein [Oscillospiraceae bacterium]
MSVFLTPNQTKTVHIGSAQLTIHEKIIPDGMRATRSVASWVPKGGLMKPNQPFGKPGEAVRGQARGICVHNTNMIQTPAATNPAEQYTRATFNGNMAGVVVHFYVWRSEVWQNLALNERGWHAGDGQGRRAGRRAGQKLGGNLDTIAIEAIGCDEETARTTALLCAWLCREQNLDPALDIWQHADFSPRSGCPVYLRPRWGCFVQQVKDDYFCMGSIAQEKTARQVRACIGSPKRRRVCRALRAARS